MKEIAILVLGVLVAILTIASVKVMGQKLSDVESEQLRIDYEMTVDRHVEQARRLKEQESITEEEKTQN
jgi:hypothetical protein